MNSDLKKRNAEVLKKWLDGAEIQVRAVPGIWQDVRHYGTASVLINTQGGIFEYRLKPKTVKFRLALCKHCPLNVNQFIAVVHGAQAEKDMEINQHFVRWLGDWQEVSEDDPNS